MKKYFIGLFVAVMAVCFVSCDSAESGFKQEMYLDNIFTVNKHAVIPEYSDTSFMVSNMDSYNLNTGDRARMVLRYYYDANSGRMPEWSIYSLVEVIPTRRLQSAADVDIAAYVTPFTALPYYELLDRYCKPVWVWKNRQNINITYKGVKDGAEFAMVVRGLKDNSVELELLAKADDNGNSSSTKLLTFDLADIGNYLTAEEKSSVSGVDSLQTRIFFKRLEKDKVSEAQVIGGKFANPFK